MHGWLRPGGVLVNVQPQPGPIRLDVQHRAGRRRLGLAHNVATFHDDLALTLVELDHLVQAGALARTGEEHLEIEFRVDAPDDWREFVDRPRAAGLEVDPPDLARAEAALARGTCAIVATEAQVANAFRRLP